MNVNEFFVEYWYVILLLAIVVIVISITYRLINEKYDERKWSCSEKGCHLVIGGKYDTEEECKNSGCNLKHHHKQKQKKVTFSKDLEKYYSF